MTDVSPTPPRPPRVLIWGNAVPDGLDTALGHACPGTRVATVRRPGHFAHRALARYESDVRSRSPDVVVLAFGQLEAVPWRTRLRCQQAVARDRVGGPAGWLLGVVWLLADLVGALAQASRPGSTRRFERSMHHLARLASLDLGARVVLLPPRGSGRGPYREGLDRVAADLGARVVVVDHPADPADTAVAVAAAAGLPTDGMPGPRGSAASLVVLGNSVAVHMLPPRTGRAQGTYGELLADRLAAAGVPTRLALEGRWFDFVGRARRQFDDRVGRHSPDVVVLHFGTNEAQPWLVPVPVLRHLLAGDRPTTPVADWYRTQVAAPTWGAVRSYRRRASRLVGLRTWQTTPTTFARHLRALVRRCRAEFGALVLVVDLAAPGDRLEHFLPGQRSRHDRLRGVLHATVTGLDDPAVRLVHASSIVAEIGLAAAMPDGIHFTPEVHARIADELAEHALPWLQGRRSA